MWIPMARTAHSGRGTVARDRFEHSSAIEDSWKRQTFLKSVPGTNLAPTAHQPRSDQPFLARACHS